MARSTEPRDTAALIESMFSTVFSPDERAELLVRINAWEASNPTLTNAQRITGWIDLAYEYQAERAKMGGPDQDSD